MAFNNYVQPYMANPYQPTMYNPMAPYQSRLDQMQQQYSQMQQPQQQLTQQPDTNIICRPVASIEEARAVQTDFSGGLMVLPDVSHGMIHTKQLNYQDGSAIFKTYKYIPEQMIQPVTEAIAAPLVEYAPMSEIDTLKKKIEYLESLWEVPTEKPKSSVKGAADK